MPPPPGRWRGGLSSGRAGTCPRSASPGEATWEDAVAANEAILAEYESTSIQFVRDVAEKYPLPPTVSYSGGKDSLATLLIVRKALGPVPLLFADTGLEFPETYENVDTVAARYGLDVLRVCDEETFWEEFEERGPPAVDDRWCCRVCKLHPLGHLIDEHFGECLSFIGQRKYESVRRMRSRRVWRNARIPQQLSAAPIQQWTAMHVWLYIFREKAPYNRLYERGLDRIGCFICPSSDLATFDMIRDVCPDLWSAWLERLTWWQERQGLPPDWVERGLWRKRGDADEEEDSYNWIMGLGWHLSPGPRASRRAAAMVTSDPEVIASADGIILPGWGVFA